MISFDRVADIYDATRGLPSGVEEKVADSIVAATAAGPETRFLEIGVGTGRIAWPLIRRGYPFTGVDISGPMLDRLREKAGEAPNLTLIEGSITDLPLPDDSQDIVLAVHIFHLVKEWRTALDEALRVLRPGGHFVIGGNRRTDDDAATRIRIKWRDIVGSTGATGPGRYAEVIDVEAELIDRGFRLATYRAAYWQRQTVPSKLIEAIRARTFSDAWSVPDEVMESANGKITAWAKDHFGDLDVPIPGEEEFLITVCRMGSA